MNLIIFSLDKKFSCQLNNQLLDDFDRIDCVNSVSTLIEHIEQEHYELLILDTDQQEDESLECVKYLSDDHFNPKVKIAVIDKQTNRCNFLKNDVLLCVLKSEKISTLKVQIHAVIKQYKKNMMLKVGERTLKFHLDMDCFFIKTENNLKEIKIKPKAKELLKMFLLNQNRLITRSQIIQVLYGYDAEVSTTTNVINQYISQLKKLLSKYGFNFITSIYGEGYIFET